MTVAEFAKSTEEDIRQWCLDNPEAVIGDNVVNDVESADRYECHCLVAEAGKNLTGRHITVLPGSLYARDRLAGEQKYFDHQLSDLIDRFDAWWPERPVTAAEVVGGLW